MVVFSRSTMDLRAALGGCALLLGAAWGGAWWDETTRAGWSSWVSLCRSGPPDAWRALWTYAVLLPGSVCATLGAGLALLVGAGLTRSERVARGSLAGHGACVLAMPAAIYGCAIAAGAAATLPVQAATMAVVDVGLALLLMPVLLGLLRRLQGAHSAF
ncbi:MAG: hypothetical protein IT481_10015 [Gammaproteobacteria bacterium]|nr:hypothetical protein [Gammaproteobacteria bacterium]